MKVSTLGRLALKHTRNAIAEDVYLRTGYDTTRPVTFYGLVNERCNVKCRFCEYWRLPAYVDEMSIEDWQKALLSIKEFVGEFSISFSGGEPYIKKGFLDLLAWCRPQGIHAGVTTNGSLLNAANVRKTVEARPFNVNVSCDAPVAEVHDYLRGCPGLFDKLSNGIRMLREEREAQGLDFPIVVKSTVNAANFRLLPDHVRWAEEIGATAIHFQPMDEWTPETREELWVGEKEQGDLQRVVDELLALKAGGAAIMNTETTLGLMVAHFRKEKAPADTLPCRIGMRDYFIRTNGDVEMCFFYPAVGNVKEQSARDIWYGAKAREVRKQTVACDRLCLYTCLSQKTLGDKVRMGLKLIKR
jgi:MoaA/NifB/PqqE/SkfB family radical SAM enzyme